MKRFFLKKAAALAVLLAAAVAMLSPPHQIFMSMTAQMSFQNQQKVIL